MENLHYLENKQFHEKISFKDRNTKPINIDTISLVNSDFIQVEEDDSNQKYQILSKQIKSDLIFLQNCQDKTNLVQIINDLQTCYSDPLILNQQYIKSDIPINEILFDYFLSELLIQTDFELLFSFINLFLTLINVYQDSITSLLLQQEFIENILSLFTVPTSLEIRDITFDLLFNIFNLSKNNLDQSLIYFDNLNQIIYNETQVRELANSCYAIKQYFKYLENIIRFHPQFICSKAKDVSQFIDYVFQRQDLNFLFKYSIDIVILLTDSCFDTFCSLLPYNPALTIIRSNWDIDKSISFQILCLHFIEKVAIRKFPFEKVDSNISYLCEICHHVSLNWQNSKINEIIKLSLKATLALIYNYDDSIPLFLNEQIIPHMIRLFQSDLIFEIKQLTGIIIFHIIFLNFDVVQPHNFDDIYDIFEEFSGTSILKKEIADILQQKFDRCTFNV